MCIDCLKVVQGQESCMRSVWTHCFELICWDSQSFFSMDWFTGKFTGKPPYFMGKSMVSSRFSQQNQSIDFCFGSDLGTLGVIFTSRRRCCWGPSLTSRLTAKFWTVWRRTKHDKTKTRTMQLLHMKDVDRQDTNILDYNLPQTTKPQKQLAIHRFCWGHLFASTFSKWTSDIWG